MGRYKAVVRLRGSWWVLDRNAQQIFTVLEGEAGRTRAVGGLVRDTIVGVSNSDGDIDLATELLPDEVIARARGAGMSCYPTGIDHGTITVRNGQVVAEVTTLREDVATDGRHAVVAFGSDWEADARRRDFTMNALYADMTGGLFDPLDGLEDLLQRRVRFIGEPDQRIGEDRLRVFRFFRFSATLGSEIYDEAGLAACQRSAANLDKLSAERIGAEMIKTLGAPKVGVTLAQMTKTKVLEFPITTLQAMVRYEDLTTSPVVAARLAILAGTQDMERLRTQWRLSNAMVSEAREVRAAAELMIKGALFEAAYRYGRFAYVALPVASALENWSSSQLLEVREFWDNMVVPSFPIGGDDLLSEGFVQGPALGKALKQIEAEWVVSGFELGREEMLAKLKAYLD